MIAPFAAPEPIRDASPLAPHDDGPRRQTASRTVARFYRPELDGLRFFAFFAVYINHTLMIGAAGQHHRLPVWLGDLLGSVGVAGAFGVDLFFALSAYLITELLLREREQRGRLDVPAFYARRALRIWPLYFAFLIFARALAYVVPGEHMTWMHFAGFALFSGNWIYMASPVATVAAPLWSVSVEEQFYLLWPFAVRRASIARIATIAVGMIVMGFAARLLLIANGIGEPWISKGSFTRVDGIAAGVLLAVMMRGREQRISSRLRAALLALSIATLLACAYFFRLFDTPSSATLSAFGWPLVALGCIGVLVSALGDEGPIGRLLSTRPPVYLGRISYGLYVFHQVGLLLAGRLFPRHESSAGHWIAHFALALALTIAMAAASYRFLEQPFLRWKARRFTVVRSRPDAA